MYQRKKSFVENFFPVFGRFFLGELKPDDVKITKLFSKKSFVFFTILSLSLFVGMFLFLNDFLYESEKNGLFSDKDKLIYEFNSAAESLKNTVYYSKVITESGKTPEETIDIADRTGIIVKIEENTEKYKNENFNYIMYLDKREDKFFLKVSTETEDNRIITFEKELKLGKKEQGKYAYVATDNGGDTILSVGMDEVNQVETEGKEFYVKKYGKNYYSVCNFYPENIYLKTGKETIRVWKIFIFKKTDEMNRRLLYNILFFIFIMLFSYNLMFILRRNYEQLAYLVRDINNRYEFLLKLSERDDIESILKISFAELGKIASIAELSVMTMTKGENVARTIKINENGDISEELDPMALLNVKFEPNIKNGNILTLRNENRGIVMLFFSSDYITSGTITITYYIKKKLKDAENKKITNHFEKFLKLMIPVLKGAKFYETSVKDILTGAFNRALLKFHVENLIKHGERYETNFSLLMIDIDFFKRVNDTYGHVAGDEALKKVAEIISYSIRNVDMFYRFGGEEFVVVLPDTQKEGARTIAERIRTNVAETAIDLKYGSTDPIKVTVSIGIVEYSTNGHHSYTDLIEGGDNNLYEAKRTGRNKVVG